MTLEINVSFGETTGIYKCDINDMPQTNM